jgi:hypothetical protein
MNHIVSILIVLFFISCSSKNDKIVIPASIIKKETMVSIVYDLSLFESSRGMNLLNKIDTVRNVNLSPDVAKFQEAIFVKYGVSRQQYDSSFAFYSQNPILLKEIYEESLNQLSQAQESVNR